MDWEGVVAGLISDLNLNSTVAGTLPVTPAMVDDEAHDGLIFQGVSIPPLYSFPLSASV